jgi:acetylornithine deacetylase/succinyl-diaminopimelate desuccinylase-like protein
VEKDGYFYGRGTLDMKDGDAIMVTTLIRLKQEGYKPSRDIILALTADEEGGAANGVDWLLSHHRDLIDAQLVVNHDGFSVIEEHGQPLFYELDATEKVYADYQLTTTNPGGHSSLPVPENAIYELAQGLTRLQTHEFPFELNAVTRGYYEQMAAIEGGERAADMRAILAPQPDPAAAQRLSRDAFDHSVERTTCVATRLDGGHANNALPQTARAIVNCRILPGHSPEEVRQDLIRVLADPKISVRYMADDGAVSDVAPDKRGYAPPPLDPQLMQPLTAVAGQMWPKLKIVPTMSTGASDAVHTMAAGLPTYVVTGIAVERGDERMHGKDERVGVESFYRGNEFFYRFLRALTAR